MAEEGLLNSEEMRRVTGQSPLMFPYVCGSCCYCDCCTHLGCHQVSTVCLTNYSQARRIFVSVAHWHSARWAWNGYQPGLGSILRPGRINCFTITGVHAL